MQKLLIYFKVPEYDIERLKQIAKHYDILSCAEESDLLEHLPDTEILVTFIGKINAEMLRSAPKLKWIQAITAGIDNLPLEEIKARDIILTNGRGIHKVQMAEYAIAAMINLARNYHTMLRNQVQGIWDRSVPQEEIYGRVVGILGVGSIGNEIAKKAAFLGMRIIGVRENPEPLEFVDRVYGPAEMAEVFKESDYVINLLPCTKQTKGIIDKRYFNLMKHTACFINMGRGPTVNQADLTDALQSNRIRGLVTDVYEEEPLPKDNPLWKLENVILTPHIAGVTPKYMERAMTIIQHNLKVYVDQFGEMMNLVNLDSGY
jgi:D-2-hydroxyacid dehydrogenase (NADP+)